MLDSIIRLDTSFLLWIQNHMRADWLTLPMNMVTELAHTGIFWILLSLVLMVPKKTRRLGVTCAVALVIDVILTNGILKNLFHRIRPYEVIDGLILLCKPENDFSFPSGHAAASFATAWVLFRRAPKKWGIGALVLSALIGWSRLYLGVHYPSDVVVGIIVGIIAGVCALPLADKIPDKTLHIAKG